MTRPPYSGTRGNCSVVTPEDRGWRWRSSGTPRVGRPRVRRHRWLVVRCPVTCTTKTVALTHLRGSRGTSMYLFNLSPPQSPT